MVVMVKVTRSRLGVVTGLQCWSSFTLRGLVFRPVILCSVANGNFSYHFIYVSTKLIECLICHTHIVRYYLLLILLVPITILLGVA